MISNSALIRQHIGLISVVLLLALGGGNTFGQAAPSEILQQPETVTPVVWPQVALLLVGLIVVSFLFAKAEIEIEGKAGWAANLPTWRIEDHPLLQIFWGGRPLTGYHVWMFAFMAAVFHMSLLFDWQWSMEREARILGGLMIFWIVEDFLWFVFNPAFGLSKFNAGSIPWHKRWICFVPVDYAVGLVLGSFMIWYSFVG